MNTIAQVGVDLAKHVLQVHAVDSAGNVITNRALARCKFRPRIRLIQAVRSSSLSSFSAAKCSLLVRTSKAEACGMPST